MSDAAILVADDSSTMRRILVNCLSKCGFADVTEAENGADALAKARERQYNCVLTDWNMPEMDGLELAKALRKEASYAGVPIMMITTEGGKGDVVEALTSGVNDYVVKPFTPDIIAEKMKKLLGG